MPFMVKLLIKRASLITSLNFKIKPFAKPYLNTLLNKN